MARASADEILGRQRDQKLALVGEIAIEGGGRETGLGRDTAQRQIGRAFPRRHDARGLQDRGARQAAFAGPAFGAVQGGGVGRGFGGGRHEFQHMRFARAASQETEHAKPAPGECRKRVCVRFEFADQPLWDCL